MNNLSLSALEDKIFQITKEQNYISNLGLSDEVTSLAIKELDERKKKLKEIMHNKVDQL